MLSKDTPQ